MYLKIKNFIHKNAFENVCKMTAILSWPQCVNKAREMELQYIINAVYLESIEIWFCKKQWFMAMLQKLMFSGC